MRTPYKDESCEQEPKSITFCRLLILMFMCSLYKPIRTLLMEGHHTGRDTSRTMVYEQLSDTFIEKTKENYKYIMLTSLTLPSSPFHKFVSCIKASSRETKMGRGSLHLNKQTAENLRWGVRERRSMVICSNTFLISDSEAEFSFRKPTRKLPLLSKSPHHSYLTGLLLDFSRCENKCHRLFLEVSCIVLNAIFWIDSKWKQQGWILFQTLLNLSATEICWWGRGEKCGRRGRRKESDWTTTVKHKNYDISSALNHRVFKDELSC